MTKEDMIDKLWNLAAYHGWDMDLNALREDGILFPVVDEPNDNSANRVEFVMERHRPDSPEVKAYLEKIEALRSLPEDKEDE